MKDRDAMRMGAADLAQPKKDKPKKGGGGKHKVHEIGIRRAKGGYIAKHTIHDEEGMPVNAKPGENEHVLPDMDAVHAHLDEHMGEGGGAAEEEAAE